MKKFNVAYTLPYRHDVSVGVTAKDADEAVRIAQAAFDEGSLWDDTDAMPLLYDDYEEVDGGVLEFEATEIEGEFVRTSSVITLRQQRADSLCLANSPDFDGPRSDLS